MTNCTVECTAIPDGFITDDASKLRLSVILRPVAASAANHAAGPSIELSQWPTQVSALNYRIWAGPSKSALQLIGTIPGVGAFEGDLTATITPFSQRWWINLWQRPEDLDAYLLLLGGGGSASPSEQAASVEGYDYSRIHQGAIERSSEEFVAAFAAYSVKQSGQRPSKEFVGLALRAAQDPNDPLVRIARTLTRTTISAPPMPDASMIAEAALSEAADFAKSIVAPRPQGMAREATLSPDFAKALDPKTSMSFLRAKGSSANFESLLKGTTAEQNDEDFERAMRNDKDLKDDDADPDELASKFEYAHQIIGALQAHPALRKFARQIADISVEERALRLAFQGVAGDLKGVIAVEAVASEANAPATPSSLALFTAFELRSTGASLFEPCPEADFNMTPQPSTAISAALPLKDGFVHPEPYGATRRFQIASIDGIAAYYSRKRSEEATRKAYLRGALPESVPNEPTGFRTRGLMLLDLAAIKMAEASEQRQSTIASERVLFAEDLVDGYRVDVVAPNGAVFEACARTVEYNAFDELGEELRRAYETQRNDGFVSPLARSWTTSSGDPAKPNRHISVSQVVFTWTGRPLGLPSGEIAEAQMAVGGIKELSVEYAFDKNRKGPILRLFGKYRFMLRARKLNGSSVASSASRVSEFALGSEDDKLWRLTNTKRSVSDQGYQFGMVEKAPAPTLLVPEGFASGQGVDPADRENVSRIIVRSGSVEKKVRWLVAPLVGFDLAELQGQFDPLSSSKPDREKAAERAKFGAYRYLQQVPKGGGFPSIMDGPAQVALVLKTTRAPTVAPETPYFIDGTLRTIGARLIGDKSTPSQAIASSTLSSDPAFFPPSGLRGLDLGLVVPIRVEVIALGPGGVSAIRTGKIFPLQLPGPSGRTVECQTILVEVAPADSLKLELWSNRTQEAVLANPAIALATEATKSTALSVSKLLEPLNNESRALYQAFVRNQRVASLSDLSTITIEHPVSKPLRKPGVASQLKAFRATDATDWAKTVIEGNGRDSANAAKIYATGRISIDRKSTGEVWAEAFWIEVASKGRVFRNKSPEIPGRVEQRDLFERQMPTQFRRLFSINLSDLPAPGVDESSGDYLRRINEIDLLLQDVLPTVPGTGNAPRTPRFLSADFDCDQHRVLAVRLVARSRFAPHNPPAALSTTGGTAAPPVGTLATEFPERFEDATYLESSASREACRSAVEQDNWGTPGVFSIVIPATRRPPVPYVTRDKGTFYHRVLRKSSDALGTSLVHVYRCWLDGDWFASGPGERLAIICRKPSAAPLPDWADIQVSRWGGDASSIPGQKLWMQNGLLEKDATYLSADQISGAKTESAVMWRDENNPGVTAQVALACLEPIFHTGFGRWYCDIEVKPTGAFKAAVKFVLARYQKNALAGRTLSKTVPIDAVILHQPWRFTAKRNGLTIEVTVTGPAYSGRAPMLDKMQGVRAESTFTALSNLTVGGKRELPMDDLAQYPLIVAELERLGPNSSGPLPVLDGGRVVASTSLGVPPNRISETVESFDKPIMLSQWKLLLTIPPEDADKPLAVRVSLSSAHANSHARNPRTAGFGVGRDGAGFQPSALDGELVFLPEPIVIQLPIES